MHTYVMGIWVQYNSARKVPMEVSNTAVRLSPILIDWLIDWSVALLDVTRVKYDRRLVCVCVHEPQWEEKTDLSIRKILLDWRTDYKWIFWTIST